MYGRNSPIDVYGQRIKKNIDNVKSTICSQGLPELNVPPSEPVIIDKVVIYDTNNLKLNIADVKIKSFCNFDITFYNVSFNKLRFELDFILKHIIVDVMYNFNVQLLVPLSHKRPIQATFST